MRWVEIISTAVDGVRRKVKAYLTRGNPINQRQIAPFGVDSAPIKGMKGVYSDTSIIGKGVIFGYQNESHVAEDGETRLYSVDSSGTVKGTVYIKKDGTIQVSGDSIEILGDSGNAVRHAPVKSVVEEIQDDIADLKEIFATTWVVSANDGGAALKAAAATWSGTPLTEDIDAAKIDEIKTP